MIWLVYRSRSNDLPAPPGYNPSVGQSHMEVTMDTDQSHLILKKSWDIALGPIKQVSAENTILCCICLKILIIVLHFCHALGTNEPANHVYVRQFDFNIPDNDGGYDVGATNKGNHRHTSDIQSD